MEQPALRIRGLRTSFRTDEGYLDAVSGIDLAVAPGETVALVGESGCGKSVTAQSIMRLLPSNTRVEGSICLGDVNLLELSERSMRQVRGKEISMIFQEPMTSLNPILRIGDQIAEPLRMHTTMGKQEIASRVTELLAQVGIPRPKEIAREYPHQLSGGMRQRVMIAIAIACNPNVLIADEPTTALDVTVQAQIMEILQSLQDTHHMGLLLITHDLGVVSEVCERVAVMYAGRIVEECDTQDVFQNPLHPYTQGLLNSVPRFDDPSVPLRPIPGNVPTLANRPQGCGFAGRCPHAKDECFIKEPDFYEVSAGHFVRCWLVEEWGSKQ